MQLTGFQQWSLIALRTVIGWHFAYEGVYKLMLPGWSRSGQLIAPFSAQGYLRGATGPLAPLFHGVAGNASMMHAVDIAVPLALLLVGLSLMLGLFTQAGCAGAIAFLALFYLSQPPLSGYAADRRRRVVPDREQEPDRARRRPGAAVVPHRLDRRPRSPVVGALRRT
jgi:thiosulfate dehydrogenase [quinone] large subunit